MTRFARAKGSKSSNERAPEDSTPWEVMKEQLLQAKKESEEAKKREEAEKQRIVNYENFLKEHKSQKRKATWCDFPETENKQNDSIQVSPVVKKKNKLKDQTGIPSSLVTNVALTENSVSINPCKKSKKKKHKQKTEEISSITQKKKSQTEIAKPVRETNDDSSAISPTKKTRKKKELQKLNSDHTLDTNQDDNYNNQPQVENQTKKKNLSKNKKNKKQKIISENDPSIDNENSIHIQQNSNNNRQNENHQKKNKKEKKLIDGVPVRRKPINDRSFQLIINGKEVELVRFDGFPIMKKDAERLEELKNNMIKKGIPKSEVNRTLKLERRRAEKALARLKRDVCYNCRKGGHNLSDCPELKTKIPGLGAAEGVCFKCGSTEHRQFECKVQKDKEFRFATCFICKEPGHIARQCPDNPKGLYPNGGGCKLCGDVTHLRKDCPTMMNKKEETSIKLQTLDSIDNLEGIEQKINNSPQEPSKIPKKIKF